MKYGNRQDLTKYSDDELSLIVFNTEYLYIKRHSKGMLRYLKMNYRYTKKQLEVLKDDLAIDLVETKKYQVA